MVRNCADSRNDRGGRRTKRAAGSELKGAGSWGTMDYGLRSHGRGRYGKHQLERERERKDEALPLSVGLEVLARRDG